MGTLRSKSDKATGFEVRGVTLGSPAEVDGVFLWDDSRFPDGEVNVVKGELVVKPDEVVL